MKILWTIWFAGSAVGAGWLFMGLPKDGSTNASSALFLPDQTTHGHYQIQLNCSACHDIGGQVRQTACLDCHAADLKQARDTHPASKFNDPRRALLLQKLDATRCVTCHGEHTPEITSAMGVTIPTDYCVQCHEDVAADRPSHQDFAFTTCTNTGCHNYHDNTALYENFLHKHFADPPLADDGRVALRRSQQPTTQSAVQPRQILTAADADADQQYLDPKFVQEWTASAHARNGINCSDCHQPDASQPWISQPAAATCGKCHSAELTGFQQGRHGMRLAVGLTPMTPELARQPMHASAAHRVLDCSACHAAHAQPTAFAAFDACVSCHDDQHSRSYADSAHYQLWQQEQSDVAAAGTGVSCATCHLPRTADGRVTHNQNDNLRPVEKMIRTVCLNCHGLQFSLNALADLNLKANCYASPPTVHVPSLQMVQDWFGDSATGKSAATD